MLSKGMNLGPYEILSPLGAGGMGEVYRAKDSKLGRDVAIKVLPELVSFDRERLSRFEREARVLASLNHPNIAAIYGVEDSTPVKALILELVEGPTLKDRIDTGAILVEEVLPVAKQIAEALEVAHEKGIIHRDLKPANIKLDGNGKVKVLDFGLAKALDPMISSSPDITHSPTISLGTQAGVIMGTAAYMSPEQAKGKAVDRRADIWAFGVVFWEMLTGKRLFAGETVSDTLAAVIRAEPEWSALPADTPPRIRELLQRCLRKDAVQRLRDIGDARIAIEEVLSGAVQDSVGSGVVVPATPAPASRRALPWAMAALFAIATALLAAGYISRAPHPAPPVVAQILPPAGQSFTLTGQAAGPPALSPDGRKVAFAATGSDGKQQLWVRPLNSSTALLLAGTDGSTYPFWSPDGRSIGFFADGKLNRIDASGGPTLALADAADGRGGSWGADGTILFSPSYNSPVYRVSASGGTPQPMTKPNATRHEMTHRWPQFLPDGKHFLFYAHSSDTQNNATYVASLDGGEPKLLVRGDSNAVYAAPGYLLFIRQGTLMAERFNTRRLQLVGDAKPLAEHAEVDLAVFKRGTFTVSGNGILAYETGNAVGDDDKLLWFDRSGKELTETGTPGDYGTPSLSPDGQRLAITVGVTSTSGNNVWIYDLARGLRTRLTFSPGIDAEPVWSPDGKMIAFLSDRGLSGQFHLYQKAAAGTGSTTPLVVDDAAEFSPDWSSDGRYLVYERQASQVGSHNEIWALPFVDDHKAFPVIRNPQFDQVSPALSPDGRWLAYGSAESGRREVYVVPFLHGGGKWEVSTGGGDWPRWRHDGKELFYLSPDGKVMAAEISEEGKSLSIGKVAVLFQANPIAPPGWTYDLTADGAKFVVVSRGAQQAAAPLTLVTNWPALLKKQ